MLFGINTEYPQRPLLDMLSSSHLSHFTGSREVTSDLGSIAYNTEIHLEHIAVGLGWFTDYTS